MTATVLPMTDGYSAEIVPRDETRWRSIVDGFEDASLYQTWDYDAVRHGEGNLRHCVVSRNGRIVAAAQARVLRLPALPIGAAYVRWGPLWRRRDALADPMDLRMGLRALRNELVLKRGLFLRCYPFLFECEGIDYRAMLAEEGFVAAPGETPQRTLLLALEPSLEELRRNLDHKWRNRLSKAERNGLWCEEGAEDTLFSRFIELYGALLDRKKFKEPNDILEFRRLQQRLPDRHKMRVVLVGSNGGPSCGAVFTAIGTMGLYLFGACNEAGMTTNGSYLAQWKAVQWLKQQGCRHYNLNGINAEKNPGTYHFKSGIAGKTGRDVRYLGRFDAYRGSVTATSIHLLNRAALRLRRALQQKVTPPPIPIKSGSNPGAAAGACDSV
jgi:lipid II:glycine glycyltransferase (peptidoglycan interpeptide bridge formation enzyme)